MFERCEETLWKCLSGLISATITALAACVTARF
jgi:hypothetical protein